MGSIGYIIPQSITESQLEKKLEHEIETGGLGGSVVIR